MSNKRIGTRANHNESDINPGLPHATRARRAPVHDDDNDGGDVSTAGTVSNAQFALNDSSENSINTSVFSDARESSVDSLDWENHSLDLQSLKPVWSQGDEQIHSQSVELAENSILIPTGNLSLANMGDVKPLAAYESLLEGAEMSYNDEYSIIQATFSDYTEQYIRDSVTEISEHKRNVMHAMVMLAMHYETEYNARLKDRATKIKTDLLSYIHASNRYITSLRVSNNSVSGDTSLETVKNLQVQDPSTDFKYESVEKHGSRIVAQLKACGSRADELIQKTPPDDRQFRTLEEDVKVVFSSIDSYTSDAKELFDFALASGHKAGATSIQDSLIELKTKRTDLEVHLSKLKNDLGIKGDSGFIKKDVKLPTFSGDLSDLDYYTFRNEFEEYTSDRSFSKGECLRLLQKTALVGTAKLSCSNFKKIDEVWEHLRKTWGNVMILFNHRVEKIRKFGRCTGSLYKQREWFVNVKTEMDSLLELCERHKITYELYFSPVLPELQSNLPEKIHEQFKSLLLKQKEEGIEMSREMVATNLITFLGKSIDNLSFDIEYELARTSAPIKPYDGNLDGKTSYKQSQKQQNSTVNSRQNKKTFHSKNGAQATPAKSNSKPDGAKNNKQTVGKGTNNPNNSNRKNPSKPKLVKCNFCLGEHTHMYYCTLFRDQPIADRYEFTKNAKVCFRCLRMDSELDLSNRDQWWANHSNDCDGEWVCKQAMCGSRPDHKQVHFLMCRFHTQLNDANVESDFIKSLDPKLVDPSARFLFVSPHQAFSTSSQTGTESLSPGCESDVDAPGIFMLEHLYTSKRQKLFLFYDSGCGSALISSRARDILSAKQVHSGPTVLEVATGNTIQIETGDVQFHLPLEGRPTQATITAIEIPEVTSEFPCWDLYEAWEDLNAGYKKLYNGDPLPAVRECVGGAHVDLMIGIQYRKYFPKLLFELPCGLGIFKSSFKSADGVFGILGGPHKAWRRANNKSNLLNPKAFFTMETRAVYFQELALYGGLSTSAACELKTQLTVQNLIICLTHAKAAHGRHQMMWTVLTLTCLNFSSMFG